MSEEEIKLWKELLIQFNFGTGYLDVGKKIILNSIIYTLQAKGLTIDPKEGDNEEILENFRQNYWSYSKPFKISLIDKNNVSAELIYYYPRSITGEGKIFLSEPGNKTLTEFIQFEAVDESIPPIKGRNRAGQITDYYTKNFGTKITRITLRQEGLFVNDLKISHESKEIKYPKVSIGEVESSIRFYGDIDSEDFDFSSPMIEVKDNAPGVVDTKKVSIINKIIRGLKKQRRTPDDEKTYPFTDLTGSYNIPSYESNEKFTIDPGYIKSAVYANEDLLKDYIKKHSKEEPVTIQNSEPMVEQKQEPVVTPKPEIKKPILSQQVEKRFFEALAGRVIKHYGLPGMGGKSGKIFSETLIGILELEGLHFKTVDGIENCKIATEGFELIDEEGRSYRLFAGDSNKIATLVGEDKIINIKHRYYPDEKVSSGGFEERIRVDGYEITTVGIKNGGVYTNENNICFSWEYSDRNIRDGFFLKPTKTEYYSKDLLLALGINPENLMEEVLDQIKFHADDDVFTELHKYGEKEVTDLLGNRKQFFKGVNGQPSDEKEFNNLHIYLNLRLNREVIEKFLSQQHVQKR